jgi:ATP-dependent Lon protease
MNSANELAELEEKIKRTELSKKAREKATREPKTLRRMSPTSAEVTVVRNHLDWLLSIPRNKKTEVRKDLVPRRSSTTTITVWRRSRSGSSNARPFRSAPTS